MAYLALYSPWMKEIRDMSRPTSPTAVFVGSTFASVLDFEFYHRIDESPPPAEYHHHDFYELYVLMEGDVSFFVEGTLYALRPGDIQLIAPRELHRPLIAPGTRYDRCFLWIRSSFLTRMGTVRTDLEAAFRERAGTLRRLIRPRPESVPALFDALRRIEEVEADRDFGGDVLRNARLSELMVLLNRLHRVKTGAAHASGVRTGNRIQEVLTYIADHLASPLPLDAIASHFYRSKFQLAREFKRETGFTIHGYIRSKRLILAKTLLESGASVSEACERSGFGDYSNFMRSFRVEFGITPHRYAARYRMEILEKR
jgi:AraC-like DNA-binding protein